MPQTLLLIVLLFLTSLSLLLAAVSISNVLRLRKVLLSWRVGKVFGYPLFSTVFLLFCIALTALMWKVNYNVHTGIMASYFLAAGGWFVSSHLMSKRFITDHGLVKNVNDLTQTLPWNEVIDFIEKNESKEVVFTFFYLKEYDNFEKHMERIELRVPNNLYNEFSKIVRQKLGRRFLYETGESVNIRQINQ